MSLNPIEATALLSKVAHRDITCWAFTHRLVFNGGMQIDTEEFVGVFDDEDPENPFKPLFSPYEAVAVAEKLIREDMESQLNAEDDEDIRQG